jgi:hypothetical protein
MKQSDIDSHYHSHKDLYTDDMGPDVFAGATLKEDWVLLQVIPPPPERLSSTNKGIIVSTSKDPRPPVVYRVIQCGPAVKDIAVNQLCCPVLAAGMRFGGGSTCVLVKEKDILIVWGNGIQREASDPIMEMTGLDRLKALGVIRE